MGAECQNRICFNCDGLGHEACECVRPMYCFICKSGQHLTWNCMLSWRRADPDILRHSRPDEESAECGEDCPTCPLTVSDETADENNAAPSDALEATPACEGNLTADETPLPCRPWRQSSDTCTGGYSCTGG